MDLNKDNNPNNLSNINFLKSTRDKGTTLFENKIKEENPKGSLNNEIGNELNNDIQSGLSKKDSSTNDLSMGDSFNGNFYLFY